MGSPLVIAVFWNHNAVSHFYHCLVLVSLPFQDNEPILRSLVTVGIARQDNAWLLRTEDAE